MMAAIPMRELNDAELDFVSGGNALDTTTGSFISYDRPAQEPGLGHVPFFLLGGAIVRRGVMRFLGL